MWSKASEHVELGENVTIGEYSLLGVVPKVDEILPLKIGNNTTIRLHANIYTNTTIGNKMQTGHGVLIRENWKIGKNVSVGTHSVIERNTILEDNVRVHSNVFIPDGIDRKSVV